MTWADCFENEKQQARDEVARLFEPLAREMQEILEEVSRLRRQVEG